MRTGCPACSTVFRVTSEQLRLKAGKVRCGHCQTVFNAFDRLIPDPVEIPVVPRGGLGLPEAAAEAPIEVSVGTAAVPEPPPFEDDAEYLPEPEPEPEPELPPVEKLADEEILPESPEESTLAAREVGLVAVREIGDTASHNRWAAGTLADNGLGGFDSEPVARAVWPFVLFSLLLLALLLGQLAFHFRTEIVRRLPAAAGVYAMAEIDVPLPHNVELVAIDTSDLQSDNQRDMFVLQATLRNRAPYVQAWPSLELTLTDTHDNVVSRRVLLPADYLPSGTPPQAFPANGEIAVRLWVEAKDIGAAGYRLYIFYP